MPKRYAREFRRAVSERLLVGEKVRGLSDEVDPVWRSTLMRVWS